MKQINFSDAAKAEIAAIGRYTKEKWGAKKCDIYLKKLFSGFATIQKSPLIGKARDEIYQNIRSFQIEKHLVFYLIKKNDIRIVGVLHESMEPTRHIGKTRV